MELAGREVPVVWQGRRIRAFVPDLLAHRDLTLDNSAAGKCGAAELAVARGAEALPTDYVPLARLLLRAEGIASSYVEGVTAAVVDVVLAEQDATGAHTAAAWVAANLRAAHDAVDHAATELPLAEEDLCAWHGSLMAGSPAPDRHVGAFRDEQGWIGGTSPMDAHLVTPPHDEIPRLIGDLLAFVNRTDLDAIAQAAIAHAQFELIHPFADGNGRVGRVLVSWLLTRRLQLLTPPPVSVRLAADVGGYAAGLTQFRFGQTSGWVGWFADAVSGAGRAQQDLVSAVDQLQVTWTSRLGQLARERALRADSLVWPLLKLLPRHLLLTSSLVATELQVTPKAARAAMATLDEADVLSKYGTRTGERGRPAELYVSPELLGLAGATALRR